MFSKQLERIKYIVHRVILLTISQPATPRISQAYYAFMMIVMITIIGCVWGS